MLGGDLSNRSAPRVTVDLDVVATIESTPRIKIYRTTKQWNKVAKRYDINWDALTHLLQLASKYNFTTEGYAIGIDQKEADAVLNILDRRDHPLRHIAAYPSMRDFIKTLPKRFDLYGGGVYTVNNPAAFGSFYFDLARL